LERTPVEQLFVRDGRRMQRVDVGTIVRVEAADDYSCVVTNDGSRLLVNVRMKAMESRLDPTRFVRVHRSTIVSIHHVEEVINVGSGRAELRMQDGSRWAASRSGLERLRAVTREV
jgi:two-component system LytT family response regulator